MCAAMDVPDLTITANRHAVVTRMRQQNLSGDCGTGNSEATQNRYYNDEREQQALYNKSRANQAILTKEATAGSSVLENSAGQMQEKRVHDKAVVAEKRQEIREADIIEKSLSGTVERTARHIFNSSDRQLFFTCVYSWLSPEFTAYVFCSHTYPTLNNTFVHYFTRFLFGNHPKADEVREVVAEVMKTHDDENTLIKEFIKQFNSSISRGICKGDRKRFRCM
jgi:hypothetical protein